MREGDLTEFIDNWKRAFKRYSIIAQGSALSVLGLWQTLSDDLKGTFDPQVVQGVAIVILVLGLFGSFVKQPSTQAPAAPEPPQEPK